MTPMTTLATAGNALESATRALAAAGVENPRREARLLLAHALGIGAAALIADPARPLNGEAEVRFAALVARRGRREPLSHLVGRREFWSLDLAVNGDVLDPRPDSETLVQAALDLFPDREAPLDVLDLGTGSGCLLLAVLSERPNARGLGVDISKPALNVAAGNAARLGLATRTTFRAGDWGAGVDGAFDLILCNPPYVARDVIATLEPEVARYDPRLALDGGTDGFDAYRALTPHLARLTAPRGAAVIEAGNGQITEIKRIFSTTGMVVADVRNDLAGRERCVILRVH